MLWVLVSRVGVSCLAACRGGGHQPLFLIPFNLSCLSLAEAAIGLFLPDQTACQQQQSSLGLFFHCFDEPAVGAGASSCLWLS